MTNDFLNMALRYARGGVHVFPADPENKRPLVKHGLKVATTDPEQIRRWWRQFPDAMIAAATGPISDFWAVDLDIDDKTGDGRETWSQWLETMGGAPATRCLRTPSGGVHLYWRWPTPEQLGERLIRNSAKTKLGGGVDTRGEGGYVILPPSRRADGEAYEWLAEGSPWVGRERAYAPEWLLKLVTKPTPEAGACAAEPPRAGRC
ncbi:MAG: bifunctional DNA primase/polymerase [Pseudomonadota bacterium]